MEQQWRKSADLLHSRRNLEFSSEFSSMYVPGIPDMSTNAPVVVIIVIIMFRFKNKIHFIQMIQCYTHSIKKDIDTLAGAFYAFGC